MRTVERSVYWLLILVLIGYIAYQWSETDGAPVRETLLRQDTITDEVTPTPRNPSFAKSRGAVSDLSSKHDDTIHLPMERFKFLLKATPLQTIDLTYSLQETFFQAIDATDSDREKLTAIYEKALLDLQEKEFSHAEIKEDEHDNRYYRIPAVPEAVDAFKETLREEFTSVIGNELASYGMLLLDDSLHRLDFATQNREIYFTEETIEGETADYFVIRRYTDDWSRSGASKRGLHGVTRNALKRRYGLFFEPEDAK